MTTKVRRRLRTALAVACAAALGLAVGCSKQATPPAGFAVPVAIRARLAALQTLATVDIVIRAEAGEHKATARGCADQPEARV